MHIHNDLDPDNYYNDFPNNSNYFLEDNFNEKNCSQKD